jgi:cyclomaltodextrinase
MNNSDWYADAIFYHIYPLGLCGAPAANDFGSAPVNRLAQLFDWIPHIRDLGCNAVYVGPVFESDFHGYDTADYCLVDRRLGTNALLRDLVGELHRQGIKVVLDTVFNHTGRNFAPFKDLQRKGKDSAYRDWFCGVDFRRQSVYGDDFYYDGWYDAFNLVKLNLANPNVKDYLLSVVDYWLQEFHIDGLRLDVAEIMDKDFLAGLSAHCRQRRPDLWLMGEVIEGDYNCWANPHMLDSTTNYEAYKALYSSHNDQNYFELAHMLRRQSGEEGVYRHLLLYTFADNHDTTRLASLLHQPAHGFLVYTLLLTMPGIPAIYYGSEWGMEGIKGAHEDTALRPAVAGIPDLSDNALYQHIRGLIAIRNAHAALRHGSYRELYATPGQLAFCRTTTEETLLIVLNLDDHEVAIQLENVTTGNYQDLLNPETCCATNGNCLPITAIPAGGALILRHITS